MRNREIIIDNGKVQYHVENNNSIPFILLIRHCIRIHVGNDDTHRETILKKWGLLSLAPEIDHHSHNPNITHN